jgi:hypothetical protein
MSGSFPKNFRQGVRDILRPAGLAVDRIEPFLLALDDICHWRPPVERLAASDSFHKLQRAVAEVDRQVAALREIDPQAVDYIFPIGGSTESVADAAGILKNSVLAVVATRRRTVGKPSTTPRIYKTSLGVAMAFRQILDQRPTLTRGGDYESVLALVLEVTTGVIRGEDQIHAIAKRVLKSPEFS